MEWISNLPSTFEPAALPREYAYGQLRMKIASPFWKAWRHASSLNVVIEVGEIVPTQLTISVSACTPCGLLTVTVFELLGSRTLPPYPARTSTKSHTNPSYCDPCQAYPIFALDALLLARLVRVSKVFGGVETISVR